MTVCACIYMYHWCTTYMNSGCVLECTDTLTSHYNSFFYTYGNNLIPISVSSYCDPSDLFVWDRPQWGRFVPVFLMFILLRLMHFAAANDHAKTFASPKRDRDNCRGKYGYPGHISVFMGGIRASTFCRAKTRTRTLAAISLARTNFILPVPWANFSFWLGKTAGPAEANTMW